MGVENGGKSRDHKGHQAEKHSQSGQVVDQCAKQQKYKRQRRKYGLSYSGFIYSPELHLSATSVH
jgi:hypothetical protein